jgi:hypothetical protein
MSIKYDEEHPPVARKVLCVDFDATLFPWGELNSNEPPIQGAVQAVRAFKDAGYKIVIFSSRMSPTWWAAEGWANDFMTNYNSDSGDTVIKFVITTPPSDVTVPSLTWSFSYA